MSQFFRWRTTITRKDERPTTKGALLFKKKDSLNYNNNCTKWCDSAGTFGTTRVRSGGLLCQGSHCVCSREPAPCTEQPHRSHSSGSIPERNVFKRALDRSDSEHADISIVFPEAHKAHCWAHHSTHRRGKMADCKWVWNGREDAAAYRDREPHKPATILGWCIISFEK